MVEYTYAEVKQHNKPEDLWLVIKNKVYDLTKFQHEHPGGEEVLNEVAGKEATKEFIEVGHSSDAQEMMEKYYIGDLAETDRVNEQAETIARIAKIAAVSCAVGFIVGLLIRYVRSTRN